MCSEPCSARFCLVVIVVFISHQAEPDDCTRDLRSRVFGVELDVVTVSGAHSHKQHVGDVLPTPKLRLGVELQKQ